MLNAACLHHLRWRKKKADKFIIPPTYYRNSGYSIVEVTSPKPQVAAPTEASISEPVIEEKVDEPVVSEVKQEEIITEVAQNQPKETNPVVENTPPSATLPNLPKVSALSLASIKAKRELEASQKASVKHHDELPKEPFTETEMLLHWVNFAEKLKLKGQHIMATYMLMDDPVLEGSTIKLRLPNEGSKVDFDNNKFDLQGYLRGHLHNHDVTIQVSVNETVETKYAFTPLEKYEKLKSINPALELLKKTFDLDV
ncbi:DNA polymerase III subunit gamma/tau [Flavobacterium pedocola]